MKTAFFFFIVLLMYATVARAQQTFNDLNVKTLTSNKITVTSTVDSSKPCPVMTETQRNAIAAPASGSCIYNSTTLTLNVYNGTAWKSAGGGVNQWGTSTSYQVNDVVIESSKIYQCLIAHTSGTFSTDLAASKWSEVSVDTDTYGVNLKPQNGASVLVQEIQAPNNQTTLTDTDKYLVETGNKNILVNSSFEHSTFDSGWTNNGTEVGVVETSDIIDGKKSISFNPSSETINLTQNSTLYASAFADGVQGVAMCRIKSAVALSMCAIQNSVVSTTDCVTTATDSKWGLYKVPFILGATNNGISIAGSALTGAVKVDECFVGANNIVQDVKVCTTADCTDTFSAQVSSTGVVSGETIDWINGNCSIANTSEFTCGYVSGLNTVAMNCTARSTNASGNAQQFSNSASNNVTKTLTAENGTQTAYGFILSCQKQGVDYVSAKQKEVGQVYSSQCGANCVDIFSAIVTDGTSTGTVTAENSEFVTGNCTESTSGVYVCTLSGFTVTPNCGAFSKVQNHIASATTTSASSVTVITTTDAGGATGSTFELQCSKTGADFIASRSIVGSFKEVNVSPGITKPKTCFYAFGGSAATLVSPVACSTGTCVEVYDSCGATPPTFSSTGIYNDVTFPSGTFSSSSYVYCDCVSYNTTLGNKNNCMTYASGTDQTWASDSSGGYIGNILTTNETGTVGNAYVQLRCFGSAP